MKTGFAAFLVLLLVLASPVVSAHARFVSSEPSPSSRLAVAPSEVSVRLSQDVDPAGSSLQVFDTNGTRVDNDDLLVESGPEPVLIVTLRDDVGNGSFRVEWKGLSRVDHHTTQETFGFAVGNFSPPATERSAGDAPTAASLVGRSTFFLGLFLATASVLFALIVAPRSISGFLREVDRLGWPLLVAGSAILLGDAIQRTGLAPSEWAASTVLQELSVRLSLAFAFAAAAIFLPAGRGARAGVLTLGVIALAGFSARSGHASFKGWMWIGLDTVHLLATSTWVGGLLVFGFLLIARTRVDASEPELRSIGTRFSNAALVAVITMALTGLLLGIGILGLPGVSDLFAWFRGLYGLALLGKILLAVVMVLLAAINRFVFLGRLVAQAAPVTRVRRPFGRLVTGEAIIGVIVMTLAAVLTSTSPPYAGESTEPVEVVGETDTFHVTMRVEPSPSHGAFSDLYLKIIWKEDNSVLLNDTCGRPYGCILLEVVPPGAEEHDEDEEDIHHGGEHRILDPQGDGWWLVPDVLFVAEGEYEFLVEIQTEYVFMDVVELHLQVGEMEGHDEHAQHV